MLFCFNCFVFVIVFVGLVGDNILGNGIEVMNCIVVEILDDGFYIILIGIFCDFVESFFSFVFVFMLVLVFIYLVFVVQFESFIDLFIIMFIVFFVLVGVVLFLMFYE